MAGGPRFCAFLASRVARGARQCQTNRHELGRHWLSGSAAVMYIYCAVPRGLAPDHFRCSSWPLDNRITYSKLQTSLTIHIFPSAAFRNFRLTSPASACFSLAHNDTAASPRTLNARRADLSFGSGRKRRLSLVLFHPRVLPGLTQRATLTLPPFPLLPFSASLPSSVVPTVTFAESP